MLTDNERETITEGVYEAYRLGKYGQPDYLPMWHELDVKPTGTPEARQVIAAVEAIVAAREGEWRAPIEALAEIVAHAIRLNDAGFCPCSDAAYNWPALDAALRVALGSVSAPGNEAGR